MHLGVETEEERIAEDPRELSVRYREFKVLLSSRAWAQLVGTLQEQADALQRQIVYGTVTCEGDVYAAERAKGQLIGLLSASAAAQTILEDLEYSLKLSTEDKAE